MWCLSISFLTVVYHRLWNLWYLCLNFGHLIIVYVVSAIPTPTPPATPDPCYPSPCGPNARCRVENSFAVCECIPEYHGNPYEGCRPECLVSSDCPMDRACIRNKCLDPCPGTCGVSAICTVSNHIPICSCPDGTTGDAFRLCSPITGKWSDY